MIFQEPKVEFVPIDLNKSILTSSASACNGIDESGGVGVCTGTVGPANKNCPGYVNDEIDWDDVENW